jgi:hypothetical protein
MQLRFLFALLERFAQGTGTAHAACSAFPRLVTGQPSKNPRYLQKRPDRVSPRDTYLAEMAARLAREIPAVRPVYFPVNDLLAGAGTIRLIARQVCRLWPRTASGEGKLPRIFERDHGYGWSRSF